MTYDYGDLLQILEVLVQIISQTLGSGPHGIDVHAVAAGTHDATQAARAKFQILVEAVYQLGFVLVFQHTFHFGLGFCIVGRGQPLFGLLSHLFDKFLILHDILIN